jgi:hypothetical protein
LALYDGIEAKIKDHLERLSKGEKVPMIAIACFTDAQFASINAGRAALDLHVLEQNEIVFIGRHLHTSRASDGYNIDDIVMQIKSALCEEARANIQTHVSYTQNPNARDDGYGNSVHDRAVFEMTAKKPKAELFSVIPKGDKTKPNKKGRL